MYPILLETVDDGFTITSGELRLLVFALIIIVLILAAVYLAQRIR